MYTRMVYNVRGNNNVAGAKKVHVGLALLDTTIRCALLCLCFVR
jgi:hypothetical protein